jgi:UDP-N-acetylglucosamine enolpyruvyl transferase
MIFICGFNMIIYDNAHMFSYINLNNVVVVLTSFDGGTKLWVVKLFENRFNHKKKMRHLTFKVTIYESYIKP